MAVAANVGYLIECPGDSGITPNGEFPAALGQFPQAAELRAVSSGNMWALKFLPNLATTATEPFQRWPFFSRTGKYLGPLPPTCPHKGKHKPLIGQTAEGGFRTQPSAAYPPQLRAKIAEWVALSLSVGGMATRKQLGLREPTLPEGNKEEDSEKKQRANTPRREQRGGPRGCRRARSRRPRMLGKAYPHKLGRQAEALYRWVWALLPHALLALKQGRNTC